MYDAPGASYTPVTTRQPRQLSGARQEGRTTDEGCAVVVSALGPVPTTYFSVSHGFSDRSPGRLLTAYDLSDDASSLVGVVSYDELGRTCSGALGTSDRRLRWRTCDLGPREFSPSGDQVVALSAVLSPRTDSTTIAVLDAGTGRPAWWLRNLGNKVHVLDVTWEDDEHVLAVMFRSTRLHRGEWSVVRFDARGAMEYAVSPRLGPAPGSDDGPALVLGR